MPLSPEDAAALDELTQQTNLDARYQNATSDSAVAPQTPAVVPDSVQLDTPSGDSGTPVISVPGITVTPQDNSGASTVPVESSTSDVNDKVDLTPERQSLLDHVWQVGQQAAGSAMVGLSQAPFRIIQGIGRNATDFTTDVSSKLSGLSPEDQALNRRQQAVLSDLLEHSVTTPEEFQNAVQHGVFQDSADARGFKTPDEQQALFRQLVMMYQDPLFQLKSKAYTTLSGSDVINELERQGQLFGADNKAVIDLTREISAFAISFSAIKSAGNKSQLGQALNSLPFVNSMAGRILTGTAQGVLTSQIIMPPQASNVANWIQDNVPNSKLLTQYLAADPNDTFVESKTKQALQDAMLFAILDTAGEKFNQKVIVPLAQKVKLFADSLQLNKFLADVEAKGQLTLDNIQSMINGFRAKQELEPITDAAARYNKSTTAAMDDLFGPQDNVLQAGISNVPEGPKVVVTAKKGAMVEEITFPASETEQQIGQLKDAGYTIEGVNPQKPELQPEPIPRTGPSDRRFRTKKVKTDNRVGPADRRVEQAIQELQATAQDFGKAPQGLPESSLPPGVTMADGSIPSGPPTQPTPQPTVGPSPEDLTALENHIFLNLKTKGDSQSEVTDAILGHLRDVRDISQVQSMVDTISPMISRSMEKLRTEDPEAFAQASLRLNQRLAQDIDYLAKVTGSSKDDVARLVETYLQGSSIGPSTVMRARGMVLDAILENLSTLAKKATKPGKYGALNADEVLVYRDQKVIAGILSHDLAADASQSGTNLNDVQTSIGNMKRLMDALRNADKGRDFDKALANMTDPGAGRDIFNHALDWVRKGANTVVDFGINNLLLKKTTLENIAIGNTLLSNLQAAQKVVGSGGGVLDFHSNIEGLSTLSGNLTYLGKNLQYAVRSLRSGTNEFLHAGNVGDAVGEELGGPLSVYNSISGRLIAGLDALTTTPTASGLLRGKALSAELQSRGINNWGQMLLNVPKLGEISEASGARYDAALNGPNGGINPYSDIGRATIDEAKGWTLQTDLSTLLNEHPGDHALRIVKGIDDALSALDRGVNLPVTKFFAPFRRAIGNATHLAYEHTPVGLAGDAYNLASGKMSPAQRSQYLGRVATTAAVGAATWTALQNGSITGPGPTDSRSLKDLQQQNPGWKPYSIRVVTDGKEEYIPYNRIDIIGPIMVSTVNTINSVGLLSDGQVDKAIASWFQGMVDSMGTDRYGQGVQQLADAFMPFLQGKPEEGIQNLSKLIPRQAAQRLIPGFVGESNPDDTLRVDRRDLPLGADIYEAGSRILPGESKFLEPEYGLYGQEQMDPSGIPRSSLNGLVSLSQMFSPGSTLYKPDQVEKEMAKWAMLGYNTRDALTPEVKQVGNTFMHLRGFKSGTQSALAAIQRRRAGGPEGFDYIVPGGMKGYIQYVINTPEYQKALSATKEVTGPNTSTEQPDEQWKILHNAISDYEDKNFQDFVDTYGDKYVGPAGSLHDAYYANKNNAKVREMADPDLRDAVLPSNPPAGDVNQPAPKQQPAVPTRQMQQDILNALSPSRR